MVEPGAMIRSLSGRTAARNFHVFVINVIGARIISGKFPVGSLLPNDADMMSEFGVSRTVLREALKTLEAKGLVEARPKVGTRVSPRRRWNLFDAQVLLWHLEAGPDRPFLDALFETRQIVGASIVGLAARRRTSDHLRLLYYWLEQMQQAAGEDELRTLAAFELHRGLADASGNPFHRAADPLIELSLAVSAIGEGMADAAEAVAESVAGHRRLLAAVETGRPDEAMRELEAIVAAEHVRALSRIL